MRISTIGTGNMARTLGGAWAEQGHDVFFGSRDLAKGEEAAQLVGHGTQGGSNQDAVRFADVIFYTPRSLPSEVFGDASLLDGKLIIDCGNREVPESKAFGPPRIPSYAEQIAADTPGAEVVKAFNTMAQEIFHHPPGRVREHEFCCFVAGDDDDAKQTVMGLAEDLGLEALDCDPLAHAWLLESAADLIRFLMFSGRGAFTTFAVPTMPATEPKYGGRMVSDYG